MTIYNDLSRITAALIIGLSTSFASLAYPAQARTPYIQDFTAFTLAPGQFKLGLSTEVGIGQGFNLGTDALALVAGPQT